MKSTGARDFLFGSRDVWFVVGLPVFLYEVLGWSFNQVGGLMALWIIGYGFVQAGALKLIRLPEVNRINEQPPGAAQIP